MNSEGGVGLRQSNGHIPVEAATRVVWAHRGVFLLLTLLVSRVEQDWHFSA